jgi:hypothetical protein
MNTDESALTSFPEPSVYTQIDLRVCFLETLRIYDRFTGMICGTLEVSILPSQQNDQPAYKVDVAAEFTKDEDAYVEKIDAHVGTDITVVMSALIAI